MTWQTDVSGDDDSNLAVVQPLLFLQMGKGAYLRSSGAVTFDFESGTLYVPVGFGVGKGYPAFQLFAGLNLQLISKP